MRRVIGCCGTDWYLISDDQHVLFLVFWLLLPLDLRCGFQCRVFLQLLFRGSGIFTDDWTMVRSLLVILFLLLSEISSVLPNATGWSYVACSGLAVSALGAVRRVCFGVLYSRSLFWFLPHGAGSLGGWPCWLKYDWVICHPVVRLPDLRCFEMARCSHLRGCFILLWCDAFRHRSILLSWYVLLDPVLARLLWSRWFPSTYVLFYYLPFVTTWWLQGAWFPDVGSWLLFLRNASAAARRSPTATLSPLSSSLSSSVCTCVSCRGEHGSSTSPVWWLTFYLHLRAALQWLLSSLTVLL